MTLKVGRKYAIAFGLCAALMLTSGAALGQIFGTSTVKAQTRIPAKSAAAAALKRIAVVPFAGADGRDFADLVRAELQSATLDGAPYFTVINNEALSASSGVSGSSTAAITELARLGSQSGVEAIYYGNVQGGNVNTTTTQQSRTRCLEYEGFLNCKREQAYMATCYKTIASFSATPQVVNVATGTVAYSQTLTDSAEYFYCDDIQPLKTRDALIAEARASVLKQLRQAVSPYTQEVSLSYKSRADDISDRAQADQFKNAAAFARAGQIDRACAMWRELAPGDQTASLSLLFNLGVCAEAVGDYPRAVALFSQAEARQTRPDRSIFQARQRAQTALERERAVNAAPN